MPTNQAKQSTQSPRINENAVEETFPWHQQAWQRVVNARASDRVPSAWLIHGAQGLGKVIFAHSVAKSLLCESPQVSGPGCGECTSCKRVSYSNQQQSHPDLFVLHNEEDNDPPSGKTQSRNTPALGIDAVRELSHVLGTHRHSNQRRVVLIDRADRLTLQAANSLLKTLEEPPVGTTLILVCSELERLPATVVSRCQRLQIAPPTRDIATQWLAEKLGFPDRKQAEALLELAGGLPLLALELEQTIEVEAMERWAQALTEVCTRTADPLIARQVVNDKEAEIFIQWWSHWLLAVLRAAIQGETQKTAKALTPQAPTFESDEKLVSQQKVLLSYLRQQPPNVYLANLFRQLGVLAEIKSQLGRPINLGLALDALWIQWAQLGQQLTDGVRAP